MGIDKGRVYGRGIQVSIFTSIVVLGIIGMICIFFASVMGDIGITYGATKEDAKSNYFRGQGYFRNMADRIIFTTYDMDYVVDNIMLSGNITGIEHLDGEENPIGIYGDISGENTIVYDTRLGVNHNDGSYKQHIINFYVLEDAIFNDSYKSRVDFVEFLYKNQVSIWIVGILIGISIMILYGMLLKVAGYSKNENVTLWWLCDIPVEINFCIAMFFGFWMCFGSFGHFRDFYNDHTSTHSMFLSLLYIAIAEIIFLTLSMDISMRIKGKVLAKSSIIGLAITYSKFTFNKFNIFCKYLFIYIGIMATFLLGIFITTLRSYYSYNTILYFIFVIVLISPVYVYVLLKFINLLKASEIIAKGDYDYKVEEGFIFKKFTNNLNAISGGMETALDEKMKSELLKTELITNVSHDIKTPLTSIINYSDLICNEESDNEKISEYSKELYIQSNELKKMIEDLIEVSKASSGNILVDLAEIELGVFIEQIIGEYEEKLAEKSLKLITNTVAEDIYVNIDGKLISKVFDNLFSNILNYSLKGTRVYFDIDVLENYVVISLKNTSKYQLNISKELFNEQCITGELPHDLSGSKLGLSMAKNLINSQGGDFDIAIDGDLFKAIITIKLA